MADLRKCTGSTRFGIDAHEAPVEEFPVQPSQKDGLGRMCKTHWNAYASALRNAAVAAKAEATVSADDAMTPELPEAKPSRKRKASQPAADEPEPPTA